MAGNDSGGNSNTLTCETPKAETELFKPSPRTLRIVTAAAGARRFLHRSLTSVSTSFLELIRGSAKLGIVSVVIVKVVIHFDIVCGIIIVGFRPRNAALTRTERNLKIWGKEFEDIGVWAS